MTPSQFVKALQQFAASVFAEDVRLFYWQNLKCYLLPHPREDLELLMYVVGDDKIDFRVDQEVYRTLVTKLGARVQADPPLTDSAAVHAIIDETLGDLVLTPAARLRNLFGGRALESIPGDNPGDEKKGEK